MRKLAVGNWKMNGLADRLGMLADLAAACPSPRCDVLICPPATLIARMAEAAARHDPPILIGGQDCHAAPSGAHTGDIAAPMLADAGASHVILGHSERRTDHGETDAAVRAKAGAAKAAGLISIICIGETEAQHDAGLTLATLAAQLAGSVPDSAGPADTVIAYEPVWAIGTGRTPTPAEIAAVHADLRSRLVQRFGPAAAGFRLLYGGSVKPANAALIFALPHVDGALVGGASLDAADFAAIVAALSAA